ncbi:hypothetical protein SPI_04783 [Niveomyces insectorum RCEF 264]|uniref:Uncharacterized protein n=1 Tax=Niveomyces insectorum RCEF 264 TaxID=1081102 RepID=A0A167UUH0_9HYPO|nr:hypothetical protein SPI_04783 [Niveomyces insectorum RCEF 264]
MPFAWVLRRSPKGGGGGGGRGSTHTGSGHAASPSRGKSGKGSTVVVVGAGSSPHYSSGNGGLGSEQGGLPLWMWILIGVGAVILVLFVSALIYHHVKERRLAALHNRKASTRRVLWNATKVALFLWIFIGLAKCCCGSKRGNKAGSPAYRQIDNAADLTGSNNNNNNNNMANAWYNAAPGTMSAAVAKHSQAYGDGGTGFRPSEQFEPLTSAGGAARVTGYPPPYTPNSAYQYPPTAYAHTAGFPSTVPVVAEPQYLPAPMPVPAPAPAPAAAPIARQQAQYGATPSMRPVPSTSATYIPGQDAYPLQ